MPAVDQLVVALVGLRRRCRSRRTGAWSTAGRCTSTGRRRGCRGSGPARPAAASGSQPVERVRAVHRLERQAGLGVVAHVQEPTAGRSVAHRRGVWDMSRARGVLTGSCPLSLQYDADRLLRFTIQRAKGWTCRALPAGTLYRGREGMWSWVAHRVTGVSDLLLPLRPRAGHRAGAGVAGRLQRRHRHLQDPDRRPARGRPGRGDPLPRASTAFGSCSSTSGPRARATSADARAASSASGSLLFLPFVVTPPDDRLREAD